MKNLARLLLLMSLIAVTACPKVPITGRRSPNLIPQSQEMALGLQSYEQIVKSSKLSTDAAAIAMIERVGKRIAAVTESEEFARRFAKIDYDWEFKLIDESKTVNAFCLPGGKVAFYTGILPITQNETGVAVVMGHEVAHAIARHGGERMTEQLALSLGGMGLALAMREKPQQTQAAYGAAYGIGTSLAVALPFGRFQESEADRIGLILMAMAGYDPAEAAAFWRRMDGAGGGKQPPEFLSTHPSHGRRISDIQNWLPEAQKEYQNSKMK
jgi:predicted Zn-dependent protease